MAALLAAAAPAQALTYANPLDLDYRYNWEEQRAGHAYRTGADPAIVRAGGAFYLFATLADGYWRSADLVRWRFVRPDIWPTDGMVAPAAWPDGRGIVLLPSRTGPGAILRSDDPAHGRWTYLVRRSDPLPDAVPAGREEQVRPGELPPGPWDPALFRNDDGRWYMYWGSSNLFPLYGIALDRADALAYRGAPRALVALDPARHGWERFGQDQAGTDAAGHPVRPFLEGAWMTKAGGRYYLQYAAPGTEHNAYATGTYVADRPLGPFRYAPGNPVAYKPGGFMVGAGHGSTVRDAHGNWWVGGTGWVGVNSPYERRVSLFPARFYPDGQFAASTRFGDWPHRMPGTRVDDPDALFTGWMLLSYRKRATASATAPGFDARAVTDENPRSFWVAAANRPGQALTVDLGRRDSVRAVQVDFADYRSGRYGDAPDVYTSLRLQGSPDGQHWRTLAATGGTRRDRPNAYFELPRPARIRFVRYVHGHVGAATLAISDLRVFGIAPGAAPPAPALVSVTRGTEEREARVAWHAIPGATGYNIRWGIRPDRLTQTYQLFGDQVPTRDGVAAWTLRSLDVGQRYWIAVEAFNESGVSPQRPPARLASGTEASP